MSNKIILGGGLIGLLARKILGSEWTIIPFGRSRFYSFSPPLWDNFIIRDQKIDDVVKHLGGNLPGGMGIPYKIGYSLGGELLEYNEAICDIWLNKTFKSNPPPHALPYMKARENIFVYDLRANRLFETLQQEFKSEIEESLKLGSVTHVGDHTVSFKKKDGTNETLDFDQCINTIPLNALYNLAGVKNIELKSDSYWIYHIQTDSLDFEGLNQQLVVDDFMDFFKVARVSSNRYIFYCNVNIQVPGPYFKIFIKGKFDIIDGTEITDGLIHGQRQGPDVLKDIGITNVGSYAEWDWCADIGSCIMSLLRFKT
jgi:hypothetical protein